MGTCTRAEINSIDLNDPQFVDEGRNPVHEFRVPHMFMVLNKISGPFVYLYTRVGANYCIDCFS